MATLQCVHTVEGIKSINYTSSDLVFTMITIRSRGPFLEIPGKLTGPVSCFEIEVSRKVGCVLTSNEVHFVSLTENFTV